MASLISGFLLMWALAPVAGLLYLLAEPILLAVAFSYLVMSLILYPFHFLGLFIVLAGIGFFWKHIPEFKSTSQGDWGNEGADYTPLALLLAILAIFAIVVCVALVRKQDLPPETPEEAVRSVIQYGNELRRTGKWIDAR